MTFTPVIIDTNDMPIADIDGHPGAKRQYLLTGEDLPGFVQIFYGPPGFTEKTRAMLARGPHRHYHKSVNERHYILGGDYPIWHWSDAASEGSMTRVRRHHYLENPPRTLHGIKAEAAPITGWKILHWTNGYGTEIHEPGAETETIEVGFESAAEEEGFVAPILIDAEAESWRAHPARPGWLIKPLSGPAANTGAVSLVNVPVGSRSERGRIRSQDDGIAWLYMLSGDLNVEWDEKLSQVASLHEGHFAAWTAGSPLTTPAGLLSQGGCVALCVGHVFAT